MTTRLGQGARPRRFRVRCGGADSWLVDAPTRRVSDEANRG